jgi:Cys-tRNA(Pro)/Cys-tRNA(Cys) deacylase
MKTNAARILDQLGIEYELIDYEVDEDDLSAVSVAAKVGLPPEQVFKTLVARGDKTGIVVACIPGDYEVNLKRLAAVSGNKRVEMVPLKVVLPLTGYIRGGVSPLGMKRKYPTYVDETADLWDKVTISAGIRGTQILLKPTDLLRAAEATLVDLT